MSPAASLRPLAVYAAAAVSLAAVMLGLSSLLGQRHREQATDLPYESGVASTGSARVRFDVKFYLIAMVFVVFDLETVFIFAWASAFRELGWPGYIASVIFISVLALVLLYLWRLGALDWAVGKTERGGRR